MRVECAEGFWPVHPLGNLASRHSSVQIGLLTLVSVMVNLSDYLKSVWWATSYIYRKSESWRTMQRRSKFGWTVRRSVKR